MKRLSIELPKRKLELKDFSKTHSEIHKIIESNVKETIEHFKDSEGGWNLSRDHIISDILYGILGFHIHDEVNQAFMNEGLRLVYNNNETFVTLDEGYKPIYMNDKTGKIHLVEDSFNKAYIDKFSDKRGFTQIGRL